MAKKMYDVGPVTMRSMPFWCVANSLADPFAGPVLPKIDSLDTAKLLAEAAKAGLIEMTSFHDDDLVPWDPAQLNDDMDPKSATYQKLRAIKKILDDAGLKINTATCSLHGNAIFRAGGLTNPDPKIRELARRKVERCIRIGALFKADYYTYWVARDGFEVPVVVDWKNVYGWLAEGLNAVTDYIEKKGYKNYKGATIEPKPNEPRGHMYLPSSGHAVGFIQSRLKKPNFWGVNPELLQHESMMLLNAVQTLGYLTSVKKLSFLHFGSQIKAQFDNDFPPLVGPEGLEETVQMFWLLDKVGWKGVVEFDCHMLRCESDPKDYMGCRRAFVKNCVNALSIALQLAARLKNFSNKGLTDTQANLAAIKTMCGLK